MPAGTSERLEVGQRAPAFTLPDAEGNPVSLADFAGRRVIVYFYPAAGTPGCTKQACDFRDRADELGARGYAIVGISPDPPAKLRRFRESESLGFPLLSDPEREVIQAYRAWGEKTMYGKRTVGLLRSTFVVDESGNIALAQYNVKATGHVARLGEQLDALDRAGRA